MSRNVFNRLEKFNGNKYPKFIKNILIYCGFENEISLSTINEKSIEEIEQNINQNIALLRGTNYIDTNGSLISAPFKFLLGHKSLILNIPKTIEEFTDNKKKKKSVKNAEASGEQSNIENLRESLLLRLENYRKKKNLKFSVSQDHLIKCTLDDKRSKIHVKCVYCDVHVPCLFVNTWCISNYTKHILTHEHTDTNTNIASTSQSVGQSGIQRAEKSASATVLSEIIR